MIILYIDPGTGSLIITSLIALFVTLKNFFLNTYYRIIFFFKKKKFKLKNDFSDHLVFFSEGKKYWSVFKPVIENLVNKKVSLVFLSADSNDPGLKFLSKHISSHYIGNMNTAINFLNTSLLSTGCLSSHACVTGTGDRPHGCLSTRSAERFTAFRSQRNSL